MSKELLTHLWLWRQEIWLPMTLTAQTLKGCGTEQLRASEVAIYRQHCRQADEVDQVIDKHGVSKKAATAVDTGLDPVLCTLLEGRHMHEVIVSVPGLESQFRRIEYRDRKSCLHFRDDLKPRTTWVLCPKTLAIRAGVTKRSRCAAQDWAYSSRNPANGGPDSIYAKILDAALISRTHVERGFPIDLLKFSLL